MRSVAAACYGRGGVRRSEAGMNLLEPPPEDRRPVEIRRAVLAVWVVLIWGILTRPPTAHVRAPAGTPSWVMEDTGYVMLLALVAAIVGAAYAVPRGISEGRRWARLVVTVVFVLSIVAQVPWLAMHADRTAAVLVRIVSIALKVYVVACLFGPVGKACFTPPRQARMSGAS